MILLPWPPKALSPNARVHWATKAKAAKAYRKAAGWATIEAREVVEDDGPILLHVTFYPPDKRHYDGDNLVARCKSMFDGIADGLGVNDVRFKIRYEIGGVIRGGVVRVIVSG
jgi:crossover junction endodeoxyribonuclease RusA